MSVKLDTAVGQLHIAQGVVQEESDNVLVMQPSSLLPLGRDKGHLYAVIELEGQPPGRDETCRRLIEIIEKGYRRAPGSVTARLRQAIEEANAFLYEANRQAIQDDQRSGGVTCIVFKDGNVYVGQAGPALAYVARKGKLWRYPKTSPWLDAAPPEPGESYSPPLGAGRKVEINFAHCQVQPGDIILLATSALASRASHREVTEAVVYQGVEAALKNLRALAGQADLSAVVVEVMAAEKAEAAPQKPAREKTRAVPIERAPRLPSPEWGALLSSLGQGLASILTFLLNALKVLAGRILPGAEPETLPRPRPARKRDRRRPRAPTPARGPGKRVYLIGLAVAIPLIVALAVVTVSLRQDQTSRDRLDELVQQARAKHEQALAHTGDKETVRQLLRQAKALLEEAMRLNPKEAPQAIGDLGRAIQDKLDEINNVIKLYWTPVLYEYQNISSDPGRVIVNGLDVYVLDEGADCVYKHLLNEAGDALEETEDDPVLVCEGHQVGDVVVGEIVDMVWMPVGGGRQTSNLLILEKGGALLEYSPTWGLKVLPVGQKERWRAPQVMGSYFGNLYLLDLQLNQILKYLPTADGGYSNPPQDYLDPEGGVDLAGAVDMTIDGFIYVLFTDGNITKLLSSGEPSSGQPVLFEQTELDEPLRNPTAIFTGPEEEVKSIYVADAGNKRIVQFSKEGGFERQFKADDDTFDRLKGCFVDEIGDRLYLVSGNKLYLANIPSASAAQASR